MDNYTKEWSKSGVRRLKKILNKVVSKLNLILLTGNVVLSQSKFNKEIKLPIKVTKKRIDKLLLNSKIQVEIP